MRRFCAMAGLIIVAAAGCADLRGRRTAEMPRAYYVAPECDTCNDCNPPARPARNILCISSGGLYGAYVAGFLNGWTNTGTRPEFDVVTGVSTGALIGLCAFLGPEYDQLARQMYTTVKTDEIYKIRSFYKIPFSSSIASNEPLRKMIDSAVTDEIIARTAEAHRAGRRFYVGSTDLEARKLVIWDMGALACRRTPDTVTVFKAVLLASCAIPGLFPPTPLVVVRDGVEHLEYHVDGATIAPLFVPPGLINARNTAEAGGTTVYVLLSGKYFVDRTELKPHILPILTATAPAITYGQARSELASIYNLTRLAGAGFVCSALPQEFPLSRTVVDQSPDALQKMFLEGYRFGSSGPTWDAQPPTESAASDPPRD